MYYILYSLLYKHSSNRRFAFPFSCFGIGLIFNGTIPLQLMAHDPANSLPASRMSQLVVGVVVVITTHPQLALLAAGTNK